MLAPVQTTTRGKRTGKLVQGPDQQQYQLAGSEVISYDRNGKAQVLVKDLRGNDLVAAHTGDLYMTVSGPSEGSVYLIRNKRAQQVDTGLRSTAGLALTPDQTQLYVLEPTTHWIWLYTILPDGRLTNRQQYGWLHVPDTAENAGATSVACDKDGRVYVVTSLGIQVLDQVGRVNAILPLPAGQPQQLYFGGPDNNLLHIVCGDKTYARKLNVQGAKAHEAPVKPGTPKL